MLIKNYKYLLFCISIFCVNFSYALTIESIQCAGEEFLTVSGISMSDTCSVEDKAGGVKSDLEKIESGNNIILDLETNRFLNNSDETFTLTCGGDSVTISYGSSCDTWTVDGQTRSSENGDNTLTNDQQADKKKLPISYSVQDDIKETLFSEVSYPFEIKVFRKQGTETREVDRFDGYFLWNFGDGNSYWSEGHSVPKQVYSHPGKYIFVFEYYKNIFTRDSKTPDASLRKEIEVIPVEVIIEKIDNFGNITLKNKSDQEIDISEWQIVFQDKKFTFSKNSLILPNTSISLSPNTIGFFALSNSGEVSLLENSGRFVSTYRKYSSNTTKPREDLKIPEKEKQTTELDSDYEYNSASVVAKANQNSDKLLWIFIIGVLIFGVTVIFVRKSVRKPDADEVDGNWK